MSTSATTTDSVIVFADEVRVGGRSFPRCQRARGIARCTGAVTENGAGDCGGHR